eukprot:GDKH01020306.1.p1 GENE.GDKH01020306.1~~GDKH01020306.1.p1  ORF type:complete len:91 (+),score=15.72 GDKH01020306.1:1-273(+)
MGASASEAVGAGSGAAEAGCGADLGDAVEKNAAAEHAVVALRPPQDLDPTELSVIVAGPRAFRDMVCRLLLDELLVNPACVVRVPEPNDC